MFEKVNPSHPDKIADRIAGAIVDYAYKCDNNTRIAVEVLIGHGECNIIVESSIHIPLGAIVNIVNRLTDNAKKINYKCVEQDNNLARNQENIIKCGDNGIFRGMPITKEQRNLSDLSHRIYKTFPYDGKYIVNEEANKLIICQSNATQKEILEHLNTQFDAIINPLGYWTGGTDVDTGATNRKLGSDMGDAVTGGGLHGKDLSKADVSVNIYAHLKAQETQKPVELYCAIGDETIDGKPYSEIVDIARNYIKEKGGFEKFAEWGLI